MLAKNKQSAKDFSIKDRHYKTLHHCKTRNIKLLHSCTIVTTLEKMLTEQTEVNIQASARRLLQIVPEHIERNISSYNRLYRYVQHLTQGGKPRREENTIAANVFTKRSAIFREGKQQIASLLSEKKLDQESIVAACQQLLTSKAAIEKAWGLEQGAARMQNFKPFQEILDQGEMFEISQKLINKIRGDAEMRRVPWQIDCESKILETEEPDQNLVANVSNRGSDVSSAHQDIQSPSSGQKNIDTDHPLVLQSEENEFFEFQAHLKPEFMEGVRTAASTKDVCRLLGISIGAMEAFVAMLVPERYMDLQARLPMNFRQTLLALLRDRKMNSEKVKPTQMLLGMGR
ncbi:hypothetical protein N0V93_002119 [Gnomoniopsis smithogilvyi]|uniref:Uncharacterized protein n=1 Tax=Gnomoniopsis smithogilvyi TaxID=1191159 RepID=A0A9W8Z2Y6_9PEZI|nr:hypothetical protein N0V93_002119 [Gnomoniopsis smithogilvyi]